MTSPHQGQLAPGTILNHTYEITALVGEGGTGEVYRAQNTATGRVVAVKLLKREFAADETLVGLMQREADALHEIVHPGVVRYYDLLRTDLDGTQFFFLVMEFIEGDSLQARMRRGPVPVAELLAIARRVIDGLRMAHGKGVLHRDLTPANIILRGGDPADATLIDFGIAKDTTNTGATLIAGFAGTPSYASPEQLNEEPLDSRSDYYSLGASLLAASQGKGLGEGRTLAQVVDMKRSVPDTSAVPGALRPLLEALLQPRRDDRPATAEAIMVLIDGLGDDGEIEDLLAGSVDAEKTMIAGAATRPAMAAPSKAAGGAGARAEAPTPPTEPKKGGLGAVLGITGLGALGAAAYFLAPMLLEPALPEADPYEFSLEVDDGGASLAGNAPSEEAAVALRSDVEAALNGVPVDGALTPAEGLPSEDWTAAVTELAGAAMLLENWSLSVADTAVVLRGTAPDRVAYATVEEQVSDISGLRALSLDWQVELAPQPLARAEMVRATAGANCGPLLFAGADPLPPGAPIVVTGPVASADQAAALEQALAALDPDRAVQSDFTVASELVCKVERLMPQANSPKLTFEFGYGDKDGQPDGGQYVAGENPVVDLRIAPDYADAFLYVFYVDGNTEKVIHLLPYKDRPENRVDRAGAGVSEDDDFRVRILYPASDVKVGQRGFRVGGPFGTNILVAVASPRQFLDAMLPRNDTASLFLEDLVDALTRAETTEFVVSREFFTTSEN
ncbi:MAG: protein kinase [Pseudomonadota bacterium]